MKKVAVFLLVAVLIGGGVTFYFWQHNRADAAELAMAAVSPTPAATPAPTPKPPIVVPPIVSHNIYKSTPVPTPEPLPPPDSNVNVVAPDVVVNPEVVEAVAADLTVLPEDNKPTPPPTPEPTVKSDATPKPEAPKSNTPKTGDTRTVNGQLQKYHHAFGWIVVESGGGHDTVNADPDGDGKLSGIQVGTME